MDDFEDETLNAIRNPANQQEIIGYVHESIIAEVDQAIDAAERSQIAWRNLTGAERGDYLYRVADIFEQKIDMIAETMTREMGKTLFEAKGEAARGVAILRYYAGEGLRKNGDVIPSTDREGLMFTTRVPLGVVGVISPWNFPIAIPVWKIAPALIYGNTVILKPAQESTITAAQLIDCFHEAQLPAGVINLVMGKGSTVGTRLIENQKVNGITFTGSNRVGRIVAKGAIERGAKYQLEMGGKNPVIIAADADLEQAVEATISGGLRSTGQKCTATSRVIVHQSIYDEFKQKLLEKVRKLQVGNGLDEKTWMGPCASKNQWQTVMSYIETAKKEGATLLFGGSTPDDPALREGFFVEPTVFDDVISTMTIAKEEIFGPVLALMKFDSMEEAIHLANDVEFGLSASIFTKDISNMLNVIREVEAGMIRINAETAGVELQAPFGGMKQSSSHSREQGEAAKEFFTSIKTIFVKG
nr:alpha-ketoglutaric semialdehyde dehydrogenase GucD [Seinonella peptonophila]